MRESQPGLAKFHAVLLGHGVEVLVSHLFGLAATRLRRVRKRLARITAVPNPVGVVCAAHAGHRPPDWFVPACRKLPITPMTERFVVSMEMRCYAYLSATGRR